MKILGIDPGTTQSGFIILDTDTLRVLDKGIGDNEHIWDTCGGFNQGFEVDAAVIEMVASYGMAVGAETFETVYWIGRFSSELLRQGVPVTLYKKKIDINPTLCFSNKAKDGNIRQALLDIFPANGGGKTPQVGTTKEPGNLFGVSSHLWSALAVATAYALNNKLIVRK